MDQELATTIEPGVLVRNELRRANLSHLWLYFGSVAMLFGILIEVQTDIAVTVAIHTRLDQIQADTDRANAKLDMLLKRTRRLVK